MSFSPEIIGIVASILTTLSFLPQTIKVIKTRNTNSLSLMMYSVFVIGILLWLLYGILLGNLPIILANIVTLPMVMTILAIKINNVIKGKD